MQTRITPKLARYHFASLRELAQYIDATPRVWRQDAGESEYPSQDWDLGAGYAGAVEMTRSGWLEGAQRAQKALKAFAPLTPQPVKRMDVVGQRVSVPAYLTGHPKCMVRRVKTADAGNGRILTLAVSVVASASTMASAMANYGVAIAQYVNQLERSGVRVHLIGTLAVDSDGERLALSWTIKSAGQPLNLSALAFAIGHPAMLRRIGFAFMERQRDTKEFSAYGYPCDAKLSDLIDAPTGVVVLNGMRGANTHAKTPEAALAYVTTQIDAAQQNARRAA